MTDRRAHPRPARIEPDCVCEVTAEADGERLPRVVRWATDPYCPLHAVVHPDAWTPYR